MNDLVSEIERMQRMSGAELQARYVELHGREPRAKSRGWLLRRCCWRVQEAAFGGLRETARRRLDSLMQEIALPPSNEQRQVTAELPRARRPGELAPGTCVEREYRGERLILRAVPGGFVVEGSS